jgi:hypothetical protein
MRVFTLALVMLGLVTSAAAQFESPDLKSGKVHVTRLVLTPVTALVSKLDWKAGPYDLGKPMEAESRQLEKDLRPVVATALKSLGFTVNDTLLSPESLAGDQELSNKLKAIQSIFDMQNIELQGRRKHDPNEPVSLGEPVPALHLPDEIDAIAVVQVRDYLETGGKKFMNSAPGPGLHSVGGWNLEIGIVDAKTGAILYIARPEGSSNLTKEPEKAGPKIEKSFKDYFKYAPVPAGSQPPKS